MKFYIDEEHFVIDGNSKLLFKVHGDHCVIQYFTTYYDAERYIRMITGYYGCNETRKTYKRWTFNEHGVEIHE